MALFTLSTMLSGNIAQADEWTQADSKRQAVYLTLHLMDFAQTRHIAANPDKFYETNNYLGRHPSAGQVNRYFLSTAILQGSIAYALPATARKAFQYLSIGHDLGFVAHNFSIGISLRF